MRLYHSRAAFWAYFAFLLRHAEATPELAFPINSQVPPVAYASQPYQFSFSEATFRADSPIASYSLNNAPAWLSLDSSRRSLEGTPASNNVGATSFQVAASDGQGDATSQVTLVVLDRPDIALGSSIIPSLEAAGPVSAPSTVLLKPLQLFSLAFPTDVFTGVSSDTIYYAISADSSPLPSWIQFDSSALSFSGKTPPLVSPSDKQQIYSLSLIASSVPGFAEASTSFHIAIAYKTLAFTPALTSLDAEAGVDFSTPALLKNLRLDGSPVDMEQLLSVTADLPTWVNLDKQNIRLSGTPPKDFESDVFVVGAQDVYGNTANMTIELQVLGNSSLLFHDNFSTTAQTGKYFSYILPAPVTTDVNSVTADLQHTPSWLGFTAQNLTLHGQVPNNFQAQNMTVAFNISTAGDTTTIKLKIHFIRSRAIASSTTTPIPNPSSVTAVPPVPTENSQTNQDRRRHWIRNIVLVTVFVGIAVIICTILLVLCLRRRSRRIEKGKNAEEPDEPDEMGRLKSLSNQGAETLNPDAIDVPQIAGSSRKTSTSRQTPTQAPQVELPWAPDSLQTTKERMPKRLQKRKQRSFDSSWSGLVARPETRAGPDSITAKFGAPLARDSMPPPVPAYTAKRQSVATKALSSRANSTRQPFASKTPSTVIQRPVGLPQRRSGAGHGAGILTAETSHYRSSWQTTLGSIPLAESLPSTTALDASPAPPLEGKENRAPHALTNLNKASLRLVDLSSETTENFENARQRWHTERARDKLEGVARFSNAGSARSFSLPRALGGTTFSPSRTISPTIPENESFQTRTRERSRSKWSGVGPAARGESPISARAPAPLFTSRLAPRITREVSFASSGQFDSALSSASQWEDENLIEEVNEEGARQWHTDSESAAPSPRLPFEPFSSSQEELADAKQVGMSRGARLTDKRRRVSVEDGGISRIEGSRVGSFRFI